MADGAPPASKLKSVHTETAHDSAWKHVAGSASYIDDLPEASNLLHGYLAQSQRAHARLKTLDLSKVRDFPGVVGVFAAADVPGKNDVSPIAGDDPLFAERHGLGRLDHVAGGAGGGNGQVGR